MEITRKRQIKNAEVAFTLSNQNHVNKENAIN